MIEASGSTTGFPWAVEPAELGGRIAAMGVAAGPTDGFPAARTTLDGRSALGVRHAFDLTSETSLTRPGRPCWSLDAHERIHDAIAAGDAGQMAALMLPHLGSTPHDLVDDRLRSGGQ